MRSKLVAVVATALIAIAGQASADGAVAALNSNTGSVLVNQNGRFVPLKAGTRLHAGDRLMALNGGSSDVIYPDGCKVAVNSGSLIRVSNTSPCQSGAGARAQLVSLQDNDNDHHDGAGYFGSNGIWIALAGGVAIAVIALIATENNGNNGNGVSP